MALRPEISVPAALATGALVYGVYTNQLPPTVDIRQTEPGSAAHSDVETVRKQSAWVAAAVVGGVSLIARDPTIFIVGGSMIVALDWFTRHANWTNPFTHKMDGVSRVDQMVPTEAMEPDLYGASPSVF